MTTRKKAAETTRVTADHPADRAEARKAIVETVKLGGAAQALLSMLGPCIVCGTEVLRGNVCAVDGHRAEG